MDERFSRLEEKLDTVLERIDGKIERHSDMLFNIGADLQEHMRRTEIAESNIESIADRIQPIQRHVAMVEGFGILLAGLVTLAGTVAAIWSLVN